MPRDREYLQQQLEVRRERDLCRILATYDHGYGYYAPLYFVDEQAIDLHRIAHWLWNRKSGLAGLWRRAAIWVAEAGRLWTGIDIHPSAYIGANLYIDNHLKVSIGPNAVIGNDVALCHCPDVPDNGGCLVIECQARIGDGAVIYGPIRIEARRCIEKDACIVQAA